LRGNASLKERRRELWCGADGAESSAPYFEEVPSPTFHPLIATVVTSGASLILSLLETLVEDSGLDWVFVDTDAMAVGKPEGMPHAEFYEKVRDVQQWLQPLYPYSTPGDFLRFEDENYDPATGELQPLYCLSIVPRERLMILLPVRSTCCS
jgi:hypothetical protein